MNDLRNKIQYLEQSLLHSDFSKSPELLVELLASDFEEVQTNGEFTTREKVVNWLLNIKSLDARWRLSDFRIKVINDDLLLAFYHAKQVKPVVSCSSGSLRTSVWRKGGVKNSWQLVFHQANKVLS